MLLELTSMPSPSPSPSPSGSPSQIIVQVPSPLHLPVPVRVVNVDAPGFWTTAFGVASSIAAILALILAFLAYRKIASERRTVFELEILRDLLQLTGSKDFNSETTEALMEALPVSDLPVWRKLIAEYQGPDAASAATAYLDMTFGRSNENLLKRMREAATRDTAIGIARRTRMPGWWWNSTKLWGPMLLHLLRHPVKAVKALSANGGASK